eukprot:TRINITY_DN11541_c0_g2_i1.p2 TRINITY_DN11541_c0_g2~~TRINITY_DN11541_c0_g2_i1.p2  ORF type:complete len:347 (-),score=77.67 TRINITY_DN11541_c0_g2_i1:693-1733(-)
MTTMATCTTATISTSMNMAPVANATAIETSTPIPTPTATTRVLDTKVELQPMVGNLMRNVSTQDMHSGQVPLNRGVALGKLQLIKPSTQLSPPLTLRASSPLISQTGGKPAATTPTSVPLTSTVPLQQSRLQTGLKTSGHARITTGTQHGMKMTLPLTATSSASSQSTTPTLSPSSTPRQEPSLTNIHSMVTSIMTGRETYQGSLEPTREVTVEIGSGGVDQMKGDLERQFMKQSERRRELERILQKELEKERQLERQIDLTKRSTFMSKSHPVQGTTFQMTPSGYIHPFGRSQMLTNLATPPPTSTPTTSTTSNTEAPSDPWSLQRIRGFEKACEVKPKNWEIVS